ncbi:MAG: Holliday junction resolvase RuvX [Thermoanaerobaculia bacterium]
MKYLAVDFGEKRIGLATSDATGLIATPRRTVSRGSDERAVREIVEFLREEEVGEIVLGIPHHADGRENSLAARVRSFGRKLGRAAELPVHTINEHLTTQESRGRDSGLAGPDAAAAAVILEDFLSEIGR